jgi:glycosyl transferase family 87
MITDIFQALVRQLSPTPTPTAVRRAKPVLALLGWLVALAFLAWALRLVALEGYLYALPGNFKGDFTRTAELRVPEWFAGTGLFYGPIFVLESRFLFVPHILAPVDFARLDFVLFGIAFVCTWLAVFGRSRPALAVFVLAAWLAHHMSVEAFANTAHLEVLELALIAVGLLLAVRGRGMAAGAALGLAIASKTLPGLFLPYLAITRKWRLLCGAAISAGVTFVAVCRIQGISVVTGAIDLIYQGGNLTKLDDSEYEYALRAEIARMLAGDGGTLTPDQGRVAIVLHALIALGTLALVGWFLTRTRIPPSRYGLFFGLICAVMLVVAPSVHAPYYIFLLPGWTAILAVLVNLPLGASSLALYASLAMAYVLTGFDQVFFAMQRLFGFGAIVPQHWFAWHLPTIGVLVTLALLITLLRRPLAASAAYRSQPAPQVAASQASLTPEAGQALSA